MANDLETCQVEGCRPQETCGLQHIAPATPLWKADEMGCGWVRWLIEVFPRIDTQLPGWERRAKGDDSDSDL